MISGSSHQENHPSSIAEEASNKRRVTRGSGKASAAKQLAQIENEDDDVDDILDDSLEDEEVLDDHLNDVASLGDDEEEYAVRGGSKRKIKAVIKKQSNRKILKRGSSSNKRD